MNQNEKRSGGAGQEIAAVCAAVLKSGGRCGCGVLLHEPVIPNLIRDLVCTRCGGGFEKLQAGEGTAIFLPACANIIFFLK